MRFYFVFAAILAPLFVSPATAEVTGGQIALSYSAFTNKGSVNRTSLEGAVDYSFGQSFSVQGDLALHSFGASNQDASTVTLHGIYNLNDTTSLGAYVGNEHVTGSDLTVYGVEAGKDLGRMDIEGYIGGINGSSESLTVLGAKARFAVSQEIGFGANVDYGRFNSNTDLTRFGVNADYKFGNGPIVSAEIGQLDANALGLSGSEPYAKLGIAFQFGGKRGATFDTRSFTQFLPGL